MLDSCIFGAELLLIHVLIPQSSFAGHLAGILAGLIHVKVGLMLLFL